MNGSVQKRKDCEDDSEQRTKKEKGVVETSHEKEDYTEFDSFHEEVDLSNSDFFGLPKSIKTSLEKYRNIKQLYDWQVELLTKLNDSNCNIIYSVPTSGGKTLVSEVMILKELLVHEKNALLILPFISIVQEKIRQITPFALKYNFLLEEYAGPKGTIPPKMRRKFKSLYIATIEKAHLLINCLIQANKLDRIGLVVVDELHMVGDGTHRSTVLESLLIKLKLSILKNAFNIRLIGMSATLSNLNDIAKFMNADVFEHNFRPVALKEYVKFGSIMYEFIPRSGQLKFIREFSDDLGEDPQHLRILVKEVVPDQSCLIFCSAKKRCEIISRMLCKHLVHLKQHKKEEKYKLIKDIISVNNGYVCDILRRTIPYGIVYHHSGLTSDEREAIETAFLSGTLCCIVCTSTLAAGVNLPAQRVIIRDPFIGRMFMNKSSYKQMSGRAGRAGFTDSVGESILIASHEEVEKSDVMKLLVEPVISCVSGLREHTGNGLSSIILSLFHLQFVKNVEQVKEIVLQHSLYGVQFGHESDFYRNIENTFEKLLKLGLLKKLLHLNEYEITPFGAGVVKGLIHIDKCQRIYSELYSSLLSFNLSTDLHLIYISTLLHDEDELGIPPDARKCFDCYEQLDDEEHKAAAVVGIKPRDITRYRLSGVTNEKIKRFYVTLVIYDIKKNLSDISEVARRFAVQRGTVQSLLTLIASNASALYRFFGELQEFKKLHSVFENFPQTLYYCCTPELIPLLELPAVKLGRAKLLHSSGFRTISDIAKASTSELCQKIDNLPKKQAKEILAKAKSILLATADELEEEAKELSDIMAVVLMIAEKPSLAESLAKILSNGHIRSRKGLNGACSVHEYKASFNGIPNCLFKFTSVCGHVMTSDFPGKYNNWDQVEPLELFSAPIIKKEANPNLQMPKFLRSEAKNADYLVLWLDCDKEGENICFEVIDAVKSSMRISFKNPQTVFRARFSSITDKDVKHAMKSLVHPNELEALSVDARQEADLRIGCAFTRYQTRYFHGKYGDLDSALISFGPCQTPTLGFCVERHDKIQSFQPQPYWVLVVDLQRKEGESTFRIDWDREREFNQNTAKSYLGRVKSQKRAKAVSISKKNKSKIRPQALNTVELLRVASSGLGIGPHQAMQIAERLYTQGYISYPRTETNQYPANFDLVETLNIFKQHPDYGNFVQKLLTQRINKSRGGHDAGDHPPITPMRSVSPSEFSDRDSWRVYDYVARHFIGTISKDLLYEKTSIDFLIGDEKFSKSGNMVVDPGFTEIMPWLSISNDQKLDQSIKTGDEFFIVDAKLAERMTSPPDYLTEADLIALMEKHGIGTDASIPTHINNICLRNYVKVASGRRLIPTQLGIVLVHGYQKIDNDLVLSTTRSEVEKQLNKICTGHADFNTVLRQTLHTFKNKFEHFMTNISSMDELFEVSFSSLADSGKPISRCGHCRRYLKLIVAKPQRLYCGICNQTLSVPQNGNIRTYKETSCPLDNFELLYFSGVDKGFVFCPNCFNNPPFEDMNKTSPCYSCLNSKCELSKVFHEISECTECDRDGKIVIDAGSGPPKWRICCTKCNFTLKGFKEAIRVSVESDICKDCQSKLLMVEYKKDHTPSEMRGCLYCSESLSKAVNRSLQSNRGGFRGRGRGRGRSFPPVVKQAPSAGGDHHVGRRAHGGRRGARRGGRRGGRGRGGFDDEVEATRKAFQLSEFF